MDAPANEWRRELLRILRSLERDGLIVSWMGADGQIWWGATGKKLHRSGDRPKSTDRKNGISATLRRVRLKEPSQNN